jgi:diaminopimelate decarboxylase
MMFRLQARSRVAEVGRRAMSSSRKAVPISASRLEELAKEYGTPFQLYDERAIRENARGLLESFRSRFDGFSQFYAVKALPNPAILQILVSEGCGLDCSSTSELHAARALGLPADQVVYTSNYTSEADLGTAFDDGVLVNLDDISLVDALVNARGRCPEFLSFRLNPGLGRTDSETASNVLGGPDAKFGVPPHQIVEGYRRAKAAGAKRFGMHMMTGSCVINEDYWQETVERLMDAIAEVKRGAGVDVDWMNIGGGLGIPYVEGEESVDVDALAARLRRVIDAKAAELGMERAPRLAMENGRYMTGPFGWLVARCEAVKETADEAGPGWGRYYGLDACMANLMRPGMYGSYHHISVPRHEERVGGIAEGGIAEGSDRDGSDRDTQLQSAHVVGTLCENNDWFGRDRALPAAAEKGDLFVVHDTGAHSHSMGFQYNGKLRAPELLLREDGSVDLIRERETIESLYANCRMPADLARDAAPTGGREAQAL